ncbi:MAG TPA: DUF222 domain-containing protein [Terriglobales bacterium]|nr:DUF222 domain-containing protein [Terriglobales bacterium]
MAASTESLYTLAGSPVPDEHRRPPFSSVQDGIDEIDAAGPAELASDRIRDDLRWFALRRRALEAMEARWLAELDRRWHEEGRPEEALNGCAPWLQEQLQLTPGAAHAQVRTARQLQHLRRTAAALREGLISAQHVSVICRAMDQVGRTSMEPSDVEAMLVEAARRMDVHNLHRHWLQLRHQADREAAEVAEEQQRGRQWLNLWETTYGVFRLEGELDAETGCTLKTALRALMGRRPARGDDRSPAQRRAAALGELARRQLDAGGLPTLAGEKPHLMLIAELSTLRLEAGSRMAQLDWGPRVTGQTARRIAEDADITPVLVDGEGEILHVGRRTRTVSPRMRKALNLRDRHCQAPGCDVEPERCVPHHVRHWVDGGPTTLPNLTLRCDVHHFRTHPENERFRKGAAAQPAAP